VNDYLGNVELLGKRVLDVGTASGFLTFEMERMGAEVVSLDADGPKCSFLLPFKDQLFTTNRDEWEASYGRFLARMNNGLAHRLNKSKAKMVYTNVYSIPPELRQFEVAVIGQILYQQELARMPCARTGGRCKFLACLGGGSFCRC
jgi:predicted nicotinamide N-methyase